MPRLSEVLEISKSLFLSLYSSVAIEAKKTTFIGSFLLVLLTQYLKIQVDRENQTKPVCSYSTIPASSLQATHEDISLLKAFPVISSTRSSSSFNSSMSPSQTS